MSRNSSRRDSKSKSSRVHTGSKHRKHESQYTGSYTAGTSSGYPAPYDNLDDYENSLAGSGRVYDQLNVGMSGLELSGPNSLSDDYYPSDLGYPQQPEQAHPPHDNDPAWHAAPIRPNDRDGEQECWDDSVNYQPHGATNHVIPNEQLYSDPYHTAQQQPAVASNKVESGSILQTSGGPDDDCYDSTTPLGVHADLGWTQWSPERYNILQQNAAVSADWDPSTITQGQLITYDPPAEEPSYLDETKASQRSAYIDKKIADEKKALQERVAKQEMKLDAKDQRNKYAAFKVCIFRWETGGDLAVDFELDRLKRGFRKWGFEVKEFLIPTSSSMDAKKGFLGDLTTFLEGCCRRDLIIFVYNGHGSRHPETGELYFAWVHEKDETKEAWVKWQHLKEELKKAKSDVLVLMDCCFAGAASQVEGELGWTPNTPNKLMTVLAACSAEKTSWNDRWSLSYNYSRVLRDWVTWPEYIPVSSFYHELRDKALEKMLIVTRTNPTSDEFTTEPVENREGPLKEKKDKTAYGNEQIYLYQARFLV